MRVARNWLLSADGLSWSNDAGRSVPALTEMANGEFVLCFPAEMTRQQALRLQRQFAEGTHLWAVEDTLRQAVEGMARDPVCPGLLTRTAGEAAAREVLANLGDQPCTVIYADLDHFKAFNTTAGHAAGDEVLSLVGGVFRSKIRATDPLWRIGDEFCAVLPNADAASGRRIAEEIARGVASLQAFGRSVSVTVGVSTHAATDLRHLLAEADLSMLRGKDLVRGQIYEQVGKVKRPRE